MTRARLTFALLAAPAAPLLHPVPANVTVWPGASTLTVAWEPSLLDPEASAGLYQVRVDAYPSPSSSPYSSTHFAGCCTYALQLVRGYHYAVSVRAAAASGSSTATSSSSSSALSTS